MKLKLLAGLSVLTGAYLGGIAPIFMKYALREFDPVFIVWGRFMISLVFLLPFVWWKQGSSILKKSLKKPFLTAMIFAINPILFVYGIAHTTSMVSQLMFLLTPIMVIALGKLINQKNPSWYQFVGIILGTLGVLVLILNSNHLLINSLGTPRGNLLILIGALAWGVYLFFSKKINKEYSAVLLVSINSLFVAMLLLPIVGYLLIQGRAVVSPPSIVGVGSIMALGFLNSTLCFLFYQWGLKYVSAFVTSTAAYISPFAAASLAIPLFGEKITWQLILSALLIFGSSFFTMVYPQVAKIKK